MVGFRAPPELTTAIDKALAKDTEHRSRSGLIRRIVTDWLRERGYLPR
jgi:hypothetical protein